MLVKLFCLEPLYPHHQALTSYALEKGSSDNITCAIIFFQWPEDAEDE